MMGLDIIPGGWKHRLIVWIVSLVSIVGELITVLTLGFVGNNWALSVYSHALDWKEKNEARIQD